MPNSVNPEADILLAHFLMLVWWASQPESKPSPMDARDPKAQSSGTTGITATRRPVWGFEPVTFQRISGTQMRNRLDLPPDATVIQLV